MTWRLRELILGDTTARKVHGGFRYTPDDIYRLLVEFHLQLDVPIAHGTFGVLPLGDFCESLFYYDFAIPSLSRTSFAAVFFGILRAVVSRRSRRRGRGAPPLPIEEALE